MMPARCSTNRVNNNNMFIGYLKIVEWLHLLHLTNSVEEERNIEALIGHEWCHIQTLSRGYGKAGGKRMVLGGFVNDNWLWLIFDQLHTFVANNNETKPVLIKLDGKSHHSLKCLVCECQLHEYLPTLPWEGSRNFQSFAFRCSQPYLGWCLRILLECIEFKKIISTWNLRKLFHIIWCWWAKHYCPRNSHKTFINNQILTNNKNTNLTTVKQCNNLLRRNVTGRLCESKNVLESSEHLRATAFQSRTVSTTKLWKAVQQL